MRLSSVQIQELQRILEVEFGLSYSHEQLQQAGQAIMRFVIAKQKRIKQIKEEGISSNE